MNKDLTKRDWHSIEGWSKCLQEEHNTNPSPSWIVWMGNVNLKLRTFVAGHYLNIKTILQLG